MLSWLQPMERWIVRIENVFGGLAIAILAGCGVLICVDVALRYVFNRPIVGGIEIIEYALVYITFLGASWAVPRGAHIDIDVCVQAMPKFWQRICAFLSNSDFARRRSRADGVRRVVTWTAYMRGAFKPTTLEIPTWIVLLIIPIGARCLPRASFARPSSAPKRSPRARHRARRAQPPSVE